MSKKIIVSLSGGKDSTAMLLLMYDKGIPFDEVRYFDAGEWEWPHVRPHINKLEAHIKRPIITCFPEMPFDYYFRDVKHQRKKVPVVGKGWPQWRYRWCNTVKHNSLNEGLDRKNTVWCIGIARDELYRERDRAQGGGSVRYPLIEYGLTVKDCLQYCYDRDFGIPMENGLRHYDVFDRLSCWCCPFTNSPGLRGIYDHFPELWRRMLRMNMSAFNEHRKGGRTLFQLNQKFAEGFRPKVRRKAGHAAL